MPTNRLLVKEEVATYSGMLLDAAYNAGGQERVLEVRDQLEQVLAIYRGNADLRDALSNPALSALGQLSQVANAYRDASEEKLGVCVVDVTTVVELDDELRKVITEKLSQDLGKNVVLREHIDKSILGGIIMSTHGKRIDASVASQLERTRNVLTETNDGGEC